MKVIIFGNSGWCLYNYRRNLLLHLKEAGFNVIALTPDDLYAKKLRDLGVSHLPLELNPSGLNPLQEVKTVIALAKLLMKEKPDFLFSFTVKCNMYAGICSRFVEFDQVANVSGMGQVFDRKGVLNFIVRTLYRLSLAKAHRVFFQNDEDLSFCIENGLATTQNSKRIPGSGVDLRRFQSAPLPIEEGKRRFLMFGRLLPKKGYDLFLGAARELKPIYGDKVEFLVMGLEDPDRVESLELLARVKQADADGFVRFIPGEEDVYPIVRTVDVVVLPSSYNEGVPRSLLEALASGKAIITTDWKGCRETIEGGLNGVLVPVNDQEGLKNAITQIIDMPDDHLCAMGEFSRRIAERRFDEKLVINSYLGELQQAS